MKYDVIILNATVECVKWGDVIIGVTGNHHTYRIDFGEQAYLLDGIPMPFSGYYNRVGVESYDKFIDFVRKKKLKKLTVYRSLS